MSDEKLDPTQELGQTQPTATPGEPDGDGKPKSLSRLAQRVKVAVAKMQARGIRISVSSVAAELGLRSNSRIGEAIKELGLGRRLGAFGLLPDELKIPQTPEMTGILKHVKSDLLKLPPEEALELMSSVSCRVLYLAEKALKRMETIIDNSMDDQLVCNASSCCAEWGRVMVRLSDVMTRRGKNESGKLETTFLLVDQKEAAIRPTNGSANGARPSSVESGLPPLILDVPVGQAS